MRTTAVMTCLIAFLLAGCGQQASQAELLAREGCEVMKTAFNLQDQPGASDTPEYTAANAGFRHKFETAVAQGADPRFGGSLKDRAEACQSLYGITVEQMMESPASGTPSAAVIASTSSSPSTATTATPSTPPPTATSGANSQTLVNAAIDHFIAAYRYVNGKGATSKLDENTRERRAAVEFEKAAKILLKGIPGVPVTVTEPLGSMLADESASVLELACVADIDTPECEYVTRATRDPDNYAVGQAIGDLIPYGSRTSDEVLAAMNAR